MARETVADSRGLSESARRSETAGLVDTRSTEEVWRRLAAGDRKGVLQLLQSPAVIEAPGLMRNWPAGCSRLCGVCPSDS